MLILAGGLATTGTWFGALVDNRNRVSLSRVQMLAWTVVLLGGYVVVGAFNVALLGSAVRDLTLNAGSWESGGRRRRFGLRRLLPEHGSGALGGARPDRGGEPLPQPGDPEPKAREAAGRTDQRVEARPLVPAPRSTRGRGSTSRAGPT